jgi:hypothetical protein
VLLNQSQVLSLSGDLAERLKLLQVVRLNSIQEASMSIDIQRRIGDICKLIDTALEESGSELLEKFRQLVAGGDAKDLFLWLQDQSSSGKLPVSIEPLVTDLFYLLH